MQQSIFSRVPPNVYLASKAFTRDWEYPEYWEPTCSLFQERVRIMMKEVIYSITAFYFLCCAISPCSFPPNISYLVVNSIPPARYARKYLIYLAYTPMLKRTRNHFHCWRLNMKITLAARPILPHSGGLNAFTGSRGQRLGPLSYPAAEQ